MGKMSEPESLDWLLVQVCRLHHSRAHALLDELGLYRGQPPLLHALAEQPGLTHTQVAERLHVSAPTVSKMVRRMEKAGLIETRDDPEDGRVSRVDLTDEGRALFKASIAQLQRLEAEAFKDFSPEELETIERLLRRVRDNLLRVSDEAALHARPPRKRRR